MRETQEILRDLQDRGWTYSAIADEIMVSHDAVRIWALGKSKPSQGALVNTALERLLARKRIPKKKRYKVS